MCFGMFVPHGIPIPDDIHQQYPEDVKKAWALFDDWWHKHFTGDAPVNRSSMPKEVATAFDTIKNAPIPGYDGATGADSCYVIGVEKHLID